jgi:hypothetical protein
LKNVGKKESFFGPPYGGEGGGCEVSHAIHCYKLAI